MFLNFSLVKALLRDGVLEVKTVEMFQNGFANDLAMGTWSFPHFISPSFDVTHGVLLPLIG